MLRRLLPLLTLVVLLVAPFGRMTAADAMEMAHQPAALAGHCEEMPAPEPDSADHSNGGIDCLIACAAMAGAETVSVAVPPVALSSPFDLALPEFSGLHPEAEPPPPRLA